MSRRRALATVLTAALALALIAPRFVGNAGIGVAIYRFLQAIAVDDEFASLSLPLSKAALWPKQEAAQRAIFDLVFHDVPLPNDSLAFATAERYSNELQPVEAASLFREQLRALQGAPDDHLYLAVSLLPLAKRGGLCPQLADAGNLPSSYSAVGWPRLVAGGGRAGDARNSYDRILNECAG